MWGYPHYAGEKQDLSRPSTLHSFRSRSRPPLFRGTPRNKARTLSVQPKTWFWTFILWAQNIGGSPTESFGFSLIESHPKKATKKADASTTRTAQTPAMFFVRTRGSRRLRTGFSRRSAACCARGCGTCRRRICSLPATVEIVPLGSSG